MCITPKEKFNAIKAYSRILTVQLQIEPACFFFFLQTWNNQTEINEGIHLADAVACEVTHIINNFYQKQYIIEECRNSHSLRCDAVQFGRWVLKFWKKNYSTKNNRGQTWLQTGIIYV
jgi:hypothetical protein